MTRRWLFLALTVLFVSSAAVGEDVFDSDSGRACFVELLRKAAWGIGGPYERAAFVVRDPDGVVRCVDWPNKHDYLEESFHGLMPPGTVGLVHTHPSLYPLPSDHDVAEAARVRRPIYVVSIHGVYRADPERDSVLTIAVGQSWIHRAPKTTAAAGVVSGGAQGAAANR